MAFETFEYVGERCQVLFGDGTLKNLPQLLGKLDMKNILVLSTPEQLSVAEKVQDIISELQVKIFSEATMHTPTHITEKALRVIEETSADGIVSVGGGSTIGLGKALATRTGVLHVCIPTTYAGSEMTPILGETEAGRKVTRRDRSILPTAVLYDVSLTMTLPVKLSVYSGINAIAHSGQYSSGQNRVALLTI